MNAKRDLSIDLLRAIGLLCIILAHVNPPNILFQLRTFDVVLMVCISTLSYTEYSNQKSYKQYICGRVKRLLLPTWQYIILLGIVFGVLAYITGSKTPFPLKALLVGILTLSGVGYLWIIRVFLYNALINPFIKQIDRLKGGVIIFVLVAYLLYIFCVHLWSNISIPFLKIFIESTILYFISYGLIAVVAYKMYHLQRTYLFFINCGLLILLVISIMIEGEFCPNVYKYPPRSQYIFWGLFIYGISILFLKYKKISKLSVYLKFISSNSLWVYFWHLIILQTIKYYPDLFPKYIVNIWWIQFVVIVLFACVMTSLQERIIKYVKTLGN